MNKPTDSREKPDHTPDKVHMVYDSDTTDLRTEFKDKFSVRVEEWKDGFGDKSETHEIFIYKKIEDVLEWVKSNYLPKSESVSKSEMERLIQLQDEYIALLGLELDSHAGYLHVHGIEASDDVVQQGQDLRDDIKKQKNLLTEVDKPNK